MSILTRILIILVVVVGLGGLIALAISGYSPTISRVETVIPNDRFAR